MFNLFAYNEINLGRAGWLLILEILAGVAAGAALSQFGFAAETAVIGVWLFNLITAWYLARAAQAQGKSGLWYGLLSALGPPVAIHVFFKLHGNDNF